MKTMKIAAALSHLLLLGHDGRSSVVAFLSPSSPAIISTTAARRPTASLFAAPIESSDDNDADDIIITTAFTTRRAVLSNTLAVAATSLLLPAFANADESSPSPPVSTNAVVVAGATGQTGRRILERLASRPNTAVVAGVRNVDKAYVGEHIYTYIKGAPRDLHFYSLLLVIRV